MGRFNIECHQRKRCVYGDGVLLFNSMINSIANTKLKKSKPGVSYKSTDAIF